MRSHQPLSVSNATSDVPQSTEPVPAAPRKRGVAAVTSAVFAAASLALLSVLAPTTAAATAAAGPAAPAALAAKIDGKNYKLDFVAADCKVGTECVATLKLEATGEFHINDNYPYKFKAAESPGVEFLGKDNAGKNVFSKQAGDFKKDGEKAASLVVRFKAAKPGTVTVSGQYKISVCSAQNCQLETQEITTTVPVK